MFPPNTRFLVVDDFSTMRKIIKKVLAEVGYTLIEEADDGKTALPILQKAMADGRPIQFIVSDWNMPGMTGLALLKACKADPGLAQTPFMLVTAEADQANIVEAVKSGVNDYVVKPFNANTIKEKLEKIYAKVGNKAA